METANQETSEPVVQEICTNGTSEIQYNEQHDLTQSTTSIEDVTINANLQGEAIDNGDEGETIHKPHLLKIEVPDGEADLEQTDVAVEEWKDIENIVDMDPSSTAGFLILSKEAAASLGMDSIENTQNGDEPAAKRFRIEGGDGQSYVLSVAPDDSLTTDETIVEKVETVQATNGSVLLGAGDAGGPKQSGSGNRKALESSDISQAWFTTRDEKDALHSKGATWKQGQWTKEEVAVLQQNINSYCAERNIVDPTHIIFEMSKDERKDFYRNIARGLQRPLFSVYRRVTRMYDQKNHIGKYTPDEINKLKDLRGRFGNDWSSIGAALGRSASSVKDKFRLMRETCNSGKWLREEERRLASAVYDLAGVKPGENVTTGLSWALVAERVQTRSEKQCRTKWLNYLNWKQKGGTEWTREDDINLVLKIANLDVNDDTEIDWNDLASNWPSVRSPQWLRGKWWSLKRHCTEYQSMEFKDMLEYLKTVHLQNLKVKQTPQAGSGMKFIGLQNDVTTQYIPIQLNSGVDDGGDSIQYEVLHQSDSGMYLIAPANSTPISLSSMAMGTDHIIVHSLPTTNISTSESVSVEMNPQSVILSNENDSVVTSLDSTTISLPIEQDSLSVSNGELQPSTDFESPSIPQVTDMSQSSSTADGDLNDTSTNFVQNNVMCTLSDPMLPSGGGDLIGSSSDAEIDKTHHHDSDLEHSNTA
ncbi:cyclin-D-binding Myb-like transcription factor 1 [Mytilus galloprovincialis]|uniref:cyclin-D-binding Myb-like transcription factor 1 n=1 Tax=Mytilus galloprovincialis TaxID=29158 RepID=UPI003F7C07AF